jgi:hypothetical protein
LIASGGTGTSNFANNRNLIVVLVNAGATGPSGVISVTAPITNTGTSTSAQLGFSGLITAGSASTVPLTLKGASGQSANILDIQNSASTSVSGFGNTGNLRVRTATEFSSALNVAAASATQIGAVIRGASGQTEDLQEWQNSAGSTRAQVTADGSILTNATLTTAQNLRVGGSAADGGGLGIIGISNATTVPTSNPTGGGVLFVDGGALKYRGTSGSAGTIVNADGTTVQGIPTGGTTGQVLSKIDGTNYNTQWSTPKTWSLPNQYYSGQYYGGSNNPSAVTIAANTAYVVPYIPSIDVTFTKVAIQVNTAIATTANVNWAIYDSDSDGQPTTVLYSGTIATGTTTGLKETTGLSIPMVNQKVYWIGLTQNHTATLTLNSPLSTAYHPFLVKKINLTATALSYTVANSSMPSTWTSTSTSSTVISPWLGL